MMLFLSNRDQRFFPDLRRRLAATLAILLLAAPVLAEDAPWNPEMKNVRIPMRDGKSLAADVYMPPVAGRFPAVLIQTPYNKDRFGAEVGEAVSRPRPKRQWPGIYDRDHYAYVVVDWRGFHNSKEAGSAAIPSRGLDGYDCVEWVASQTWCDGKVGTWGGSALGKQQFDTAAEKPPHLVCCVPLIAYMGQRYEGYFCGGVYREAHVKTLLLLGYAVGRVLEARAPDRPLWRFVKRKTYRPDEIDVPMLIVTGWWDHFPDEILEMFADVRARADSPAGRHSRLLVGPWTHMGVDLAAQGGLEFPDAADTERKATMAFFDYWLRGKKDNQWDLTPAVRYYEAFDLDGGAGRWVYGERWPDREAEKRTLFLHADGRISEQEPAASSAEAPLTRSYRYDPRTPSPTLGGANLPPLPSGPTDQGPLKKRADILVYSTGPLEKPLRILGNVEVALSFSINRADADFSVRLCDTGPDGKAILLGDTIRRAKFRSGNRADPLDPGEPASMTLRLPVLAYTIRAGHALEILVSSSNYPRFERNPHTGDDAWDEAKALDLEATIFHGKDRASTVTVPVRTD